MNSRPPKRITHFLERICPDYLFEGIVGDLEEEFYSDLDNYGLRKARRRYWWNAVRFMRPEILLRNKFKVNNSSMLGNYIKIAGRNMAKRKLFSFINAFGLSVGIAFCILIYLFIQDEKSFDQFHTNKDRIYRLEEKKYDTWGKKTKGLYKYSAYLQMGLGLAVKEEVPQVQYTTRFNSGGEGIVTYGGKVFTEKITFVDQDFFHMFSFPIVSGNRSALLTDKYSVVLTPAIADKYFGSQDVLGKVMKIDTWGENEYTVTGIIAAPPANSSLEYEILISQENRAFYTKNIEQWSNFSTPTFVQLYPDASLAQMEENLSAIVEKYMSEKLERTREREKLPEDFNLFEYQYSSLGDIHLNTEVRWHKGSDPQYSLILGGIAIVMLIIAAINYISLSLTTSASRKTEVGIRKAVGAHRSQLINQFSLESILLALISFVFGIVLVYLFLPAFNEFTNKGIEISLITIVEVIGVGVVLAIFIGLIAGCYPAFFLSAFKPSQVLKGGFTTKLKAGFTQPLVVLQFALSAFLIISSVIMYRQMEYVTNKDLGYDKEQILVVPTQMGWNEESNKMVERMRVRLGKESFVTEMTGTSLSFNQGWSRYGYKVDGENKVAYVYAVDPNYLNVLDIELKEGRNFSAEIASDTSAVIINEALAKNMNWDNPLDEYLNYQEDSIGPGAKVIGVVKDYHFLSLEHEIEPLLLSMDKESIGFLTNMLIKIKPGEVPASIAKLEQIWQELLPDKPFDYTFLDQDVQSQYESYNRWMKIMGLSTLFAILISCLGLFGLAGVNAINRTKEIGIRKVFGAEIMNIFVLLNKQYIFLALIAFVLASPLSWYIMESWLADFQYAVSLSWHLFAVSMLAGLIIALITVSYHALRTAKLNPAETLKYE